MEDQIIMVLERVIPIDEAAERLDISVKVLTRCIENGIIKAVQLPNGEIAVSAEEIRPITKKQFEHLRGKPITISEASRPRPRFDDDGNVVGGYEVPDPTMRGWIRQGYVRVLEDGYGKKLDEADVAYCAAVYHERKDAGSMSGEPLFDEAGRPYQLKHPQLSKYRRRKKLRNLSE